MLGGLAICLCSWAKDNGGRGTAVGAEALLGRWWRLAQANG